MEESYIQQQSATRAGATNHDWLPITYAKSPPFFCLANLCVQARRLHSDETFRPFWLPFAFSDDWACQTLRCFMIWEIFENANLKKSQAVWLFFGFPEMPF